MQRAPWKVSSAGLFLVFCFWDSHSPFDPRVPFDISLFPFSSSIPFSQAILAFSLPAARYRVMRSVLPSSTARCCGCFPLFSPIAASDLFSLDMPLLAPSFFPVRHMFPSSCAMIFFRIPFSIRSSLPIFLTKKEPQPSGPRFPFTISIHSWRHSVPARMHLFRSPVPQPPSQIPPYRRTRQSVWSLPFQRLCSANTPRQSACVPWLCGIRSPLSEVVSPLYGRLSKRAWVFPPLAAQR